MPIYVPHKKNRFVLTCSCWKVATGFDDKKRLHSMIAGHTNNIADGCFGHIELHIKSTEVSMVAFVTLSVI